MPTREVRRIVKRYAKLVSVEDWRLLHPRRLRHWTEDACKPYVKNEMELSDICAIPSRGSVRPAATTGRSATSEGEKR